MEDCFCVIKEKGTERIRGFFRKSWLFAAMAGRYAETDAGCTAWIGSQEFGFDGLPIQKLFEAVKSYEDISVLLVEPESDKADDLPDNAGVDYPIDNV